MQQELWHRAKSQVLSSLKAVCAMRAAASHPLPPPPPSSERELRNALSNSDGPVANSLKPSQLRTRTSSSALSNSHGSPHGFLHRENATKPNAAGNLWNLNNPVKASRSHQELHKELLLAHRKQLAMTTWAAIVHHRAIVMEDVRGLAVCCKPELQMVLERRKREQTQREEGEHCRSDLEQVLLRRQQKQQEREKEQEEKVQHEIQLMEFIRVRQNLRKVHSALRKTS